MKDWIREGFNSFLRLATFMELEECDHIGMILL